MNYLLPVTLCSLDFSERGLKAHVLNGKAEILPTATDAEIQAIVDFIAVATPCQHVAVSEPQKEATDKWLALLAQFNAIPAGVEYDATRTRLDAAVTAARDVVIALGGFC